jgi:hypothetical protein
MTALRSVATLRFKSARDPSGGGYPLGFHGWSLNQKNAWFCGFNQEFSERVRTVDTIDGEAMNRSTVDSLSLQSTLETQ